MCHEAEHGEDDETGQETGQTVDGTGQEGISARKSIVSMREKRGSAEARTCSNCC